ncbi:hypothetical protein [Lysinibacillus sp. NPDC086135]|uniref:hypothetical protein n=1 Tax=Lysinibacillus sp. NPDC086135 TaxID=3364130 RepID=UPI00380383EF
MSEKTKFYSRCYIGKGIDGADEYGYTYSWNSSHPELVETKTVKISRYTYCAYCGENANPIQAGLVGDGRDYSVTGYTCSCNCKGSQNEVEYFKELEELKQKFYKEEESLVNKYSELLQVDVEKLICIKHQYELARIEREKNRNIGKRDYFNFDGDVNSLVY